MKKIMIAEAFSVCVFLGGANCMVADDTVQDVPATDNAVVPEPVVTEAPESVNENTANTAEVATADAGIADVATANVTTGAVATTDTAIADAVQENAPGVPTPQVTTNTTPNKRPKGKGSWWDNILKLFKISEEKRTSEQALNDMQKNQNVVIDFSNVTDFAQNGDAKMQEYYQQIVSTKAFGTKSPNLYVNLSNTGVSSDFIAKWAEQFKKDKKTVIWNLSENKTLDDNVIDALDFPSIYSLNLSGTSVTDTGIAKISAILATSGIGNLVCIHLSGANVTDTGVASLKSAMQKANELWKTQNPGKDRKLQGTDNSGVVFEKIPDLKRKSRKNKSEAPQQPGVPIPATPETVVTDTVANQSTIDASAPKSAGTVEPMPEIPLDENASNDVKEDILSSGDTAPLTAQPVDEIPVETTNQGLATNQNSIEQEAQNALNSANTILDATNESN